MNQVLLFGMKIDRIDLNEAAQTLLDWSSHPATEGCRYVVTPNVDHAVLLRHHGGLRNAYQHASMVVADGAPLVAAARLLGRPLRGRVAGSDLVPRMLEFASYADSLRNRPLRVFLLGAAPGVAQRAAIHIVRRYANVEVVGVHSPPLGFEHDDDANRLALEEVARHNPDLLVVGLGAPKQELWVHRHANEIHARVAICAGATIDFLAGDKRRSPRWMQRVGLEWLHRLASEPRRLASRYFRDAIVFPQLVWHEWRGVAR
jgi:N-acetylglucosaminyldiphosphoundecaprenol N-acetyl-beta-D-mannosaminyltransferase